MWRTLMAVALSVSLLLPAPRAGALSGEPPSAQEVLEGAELIVIARAGELLGTIDRAGGPIYSLHRLHVESYIRPGESGPDTLVLASIGGMGLYRAMDGPKPSSQRALYFLRRTGDLYQKAAGPFTPTMPLTDGGFAPEIRKWLHEDFRPLLDAPRHPAYRAPMVRLNGRRIGGPTPPRLVAGRTLFPAGALAGAVGASARRGANGELELQRGTTVVQLAPGRLDMEVRTAERSVTVDLDTAPRADGDSVLVPLRAVAVALGADVWWDADRWTVDLALPDPVPEPAYLSQAAAVGRLAEAVDAVIQEHKSTGSFADSYTIAAARFNRAWLDPRTGGERSVWELDVAFRSRPGDPYMTVIVDAVTAELLLYLRCCSSR